MSLHKWGMFSVDRGLIHYTGVDPFHTHEGVSEWRAVGKEVQQSVKSIPDHKGLLVSGGFPVERFERCENNSDDDNNKE